MGGFGLMEESGRAGRGEDAWVAQRRGCQGGRVFGEQTG